MHKLKKALLIFTSIAAIIGVIVVLCISPLTKYLIEKYDEKYVGRQITMNWAYVNPFTGYVHFNDLKIYESRSDNIFISAKGFSANISIIKLFSSTYEISELILDSPHGVISQNKNKLNLDDLIIRFSSAGDSVSKKQPVRFSILNIKINEGEFYYREELIPINYFIKKVTIESSGLQWNSDTIAVRFSFLPGQGSGNMEGNFTINTKNLNYRLATILHNFDLNIIQQYLKDLANYGNFSANLDADIKATGSFTNKEDIKATGMLAINKFHFGKTKKEDYASFEKLSLNIIELNPGSFKYYFDSVSLRHPYLKYELYDHLDNIQAMFGKNGSNVASVNADPAKFNLVIEIANYIKVLSKNFFQSNYKINRLRISEGNLKYNDFSVSEEFSVSLNPLTVSADSIDKNHKRAKASFNCGIKPYGNAEVILSINPHAAGDFDMYYHLRKLPAALFNPYTISYTSFPLDRGTIEINGGWNVRNGIIQGENHLVIIDPRTTKRMRNKDAKWIPLPLILSFIRERGNVIDYEIPITGNLKNPKFHIKDIIFDLLGNIFIKPVTTPYRMQVKNIETEIEKSLTIKWKMRSCLLRSNQEKFIKEMADFLIDNPDASITVHPQQYALKEKEYILFFEAKKKYFLAINCKTSFSEEDSLIVDKISSKDSVFVHYLNNHISTSMLFTIQEKCVRYVGSAIVSKKFNQLIKERENAFLFYFKKREVEKRVSILKEEHVIPYNGFSFYKIEYKNEFPDDLIKAYKRMNELNDETPRKKFKEERRKNNRTLY
ncbi:MAG TPA: DUF748 domain-containing protein [Bacteroidia bacterium]|nr:DUF748 domain-containing protein [Bacteroidia bacterium]